VVTGYGRVPAADGGAANYFFDIARYGCLQ
jgi:hypothetical protein